MKEKKPKKTSKNLGGYPPSSSRVLLGFSFALSWLSPGAPDSLPYECPEGILENYQAPDRSSTDTAELELPLIQENEASGNKPATGSLSSPCASRFTAKNATNTNRLTNRFMDLWIEGSWPSKLPQTVDEG